MIFGLHHVRAWAERSWRTGPRVARCRLARWLVPISDTKLRHALNLLVGPRRPCLLMHSSLASCGRIHGGAEAVIREVGACCDLLCLPTHTYCYPSHPGAPGPTFDSRLTPSRVGQITEFFWRQPGAFRSVHPTHSLAARGPGAADLCAGHELCDTPCGRGTPYERLVRHDAAVLMFGVTLDTYTLFHTAEDAAGCPYLYEPTPYDLRARDHAGTERRVLMRRQDMKVPRRFAAVAEVLAAEGLLRSRRLGLGRLLFLPSARAVHDFLVRELARDPYYLTADRSRPGGR